MKVLSSTEANTAIPDHLSEVIYHLQRWNCNGLSSDHFSAGDAVEQTRDRALFPSRLANHQHNNIQTHVVKLHLQACPSASQFVIVDLIPALIVPVYMQPVVYVS